MAAFFLRKKNSKSLDTTVKMLNKPRSIGTNFLFYCDDVHNKNSEEQYLATEQYSIAILEVSWALESFEC